MTSLLAGLTVAIVAGQPAPTPTGWRLVSGPYTAEYQGHACTILQLEGPAGATAQVVRWPADDAVAEERPGGWQPVSLAGAERSWWRDSGWGLQARIWAAGLRYEVTVRAAEPCEDTLAAVWRTVTAALALLENRASVADVRARDPAGLVRELWVPAFAQLSLHPPARPWLRPGGIVKELTVGPPGPEGAPCSQRQQFEPATTKVAFSAIFRTTRWRSVRIVWLMGGRPVRASRARVGPGSRLVGSLRASHGLPVGGYRLEIWSSSGVEARADFVVMPPKLRVQR